MMRPLLYTVLLLLTLVGAARAAAPNTLGYQGRLATVGGSPITANLNITFRIFDVPTAGTALWEETQNAVPVDGGNLAVELGAVTPLPTDIWGRQLYLGVQIAGDSEMLPRPPLTASPFALRAGGTVRNTIEVSAQGSAAENGMALLAALPRLAVASATNPLALELDAGIYDIGNQRLDLPSFVTISGRGQEATLLTSVFPAGTLLLASNSHARRLTARNTGIPPTDNDFAFGIGASDDIANLGLAQNISLEDVTGESIAAPGTTGARQGIFLCTQDSRVVNAIGRGVGGNYSFGMRSDCGNNLNSSNLFIDGLTLYSSGGALGVRGAYIAGGGAWSNIKVLIETNATALSVYGVRAFHSALDVGAAFVNLAVNVSGEYIASTTGGSLIEGIRLESVDIGFLGAYVNVDRVRAQNIAGIRVITSPTGPNPVPDIVSMSGATVVVDGVQQANLGPGNIIGVRASNAALQLSKSTVTVRCVAGGANGCIGVKRENQGALQPGALLLDQDSIVVGHEAPADTSAQSRAYEGEGQARIVNSSLRVLRSSAGEFHAGVLASGADSDIRVLNSIIEIESIAPPTADCVLGGGVGAIELFSSHVQGSSCAAGATLTCAGNTKRGAGFLASTCP